MTVPPATPSIPTTTRAAVINGYGGPEQLVLAEVPIPGLTDTQVLLDVSAVAVNPVDLTTRAGVSIPEKDARFPMVLGWDVAGTVLAIGAAVTDLELGDRVAAMVFQPIDQRGTYAKYLTLDASLLAKVPDELTLQQAATVPLVSLTASQLLDEVTADGAKTLLVTGPLGAVGRHVVALAARAGLEVIGAAAAERADDLRTLGAALTVDRSNFTDAVRERYPDGVDAAIDLVGGSASHAAFGVVRDGGRYATAVPPYVDASGRFEPEREVTIHVLTVAPDTDRLTDLLALAAQGVLGTAVEHTYPLADAADAHRRQIAGGLRGRVVLIP
ncbi:MAG TPA: NADP-dependent oxidoreductase [Jatrophihabitans sp.]|nr:NADP-dependent oxidoreductase [Jatrophihabitans sp.]